MTKVNVVTRTYQGSGKYLETPRGIALFHQFGCDYEEFETGVGNYTTAIIEWPDGKVEAVQPQCITFVQDEGAVARNNLKITESLISAQPVMQATYLEVGAEVRYWEDATINGATDTDGTLTPLRKGDLWASVIRLADGSVMDWPQGTTADIHFKVCDAGEYWLLDDERKRVAKWTGLYVPDDFLCQCKNGYGDYIILKVGADGKIEKWRAPAIEMVCDCDEDAQSGWRKLPNVM